MSNSTLITDYLGRGVLASRPATPVVPAGSTAFYYATDTTQLFVWNGAAWVSAGAPSGTGAIAQNYDWNVDDAWMSGLYVHPTDGKTITGLHNSGVDSAIRGYASHAAASGKFYFEFLVNIVDNHWPITGVGSASAALSGFVGSDANGWGMATTTAVSWHTNATTAQNAYANGDILGVAVDFTAGTGSIKFLKNNAAQLADYTGLTLGTMYPMTSMRGSSANAKGKLRLRAADQTYAPPAGYSPWS